MHRVRRYFITCLCPNLVSFPFYAIPIFPFKFPKLTCLPLFFAYPKQIYIVYRDVYHNVDLCVSKLYPISFSEAFVGEI